MNIICLLGNKRFLTGVVVSVILIVGIQYALTPHHLHISSDPRWTPEIHKALKHHIMKLSLRSVGASLLRSNLRAKYPCLKDVSISYKSSLEAFVTLKGWRPLLVLRSSLPGYKEYILCEEGTVIEKNYFNYVSLQGLPTITIEGKNYEEIRQLPALIAMALLLKSTLFENYTITWHAKTNICLQDKHKPITIIADTLSIHDQERYRYLERIFESEKKYSKGMKADIRLKDSLVCAPYIKGTIL